MPPAPVVVPDAALATIPVPPDTQPLLERGAPQALVLDPLPDLAALSVRDKVAQLVMPWIGGEYWSTDDSAMSAALRLVLEQHVGGFVVGLGGSAYDLAAKFNALQRASPLPLLVAADLESGPSARIRGGTSFPVNMALGASSRELDAYDVGRIVALEARAVGIQMDFAPVVDVNNNPANPIINVRSFGEDPARVGFLASEFVRGLREHGMMATAKHFPGHGDTGTDSHIALPVITAGRPRLDSVELAPFRTAMAADVDAVMTGHIAMPGLTGGSDVPATLSATVLDTLLRGELGFRGLVVTDALNMGAIVSRYGAGNAAVLALKADADILLMPADPATAIDAVTRAVERGEVSEARLDSSVARVLAAKLRAGLFHRRTVDLGAIASAVGTLAHEALADSIARRSIVLVKDSLGLVPLDPARRRIAVVSYGTELETSVGNTFLATLRTDATLRPRTFRIWPSSGPASYDSVRVMAAQSDLVVVLVSAHPAAWRPSAVSMPDSLAALVGQLSRSGASVVTIAMGSPYLFAQVPDSPGYLVAWSDDEPAERAAADALLGRSAISGRLPVALPPWFAIGTGLQRASAR